MNIKPYFQAKLKRKLLENGLLICKFSMLRVNGLVTKINSPGTKQLAKDKMTNFHAKFMTWNLVQFSP